MSNAQSLEQGKHSEGKGQGKGNKKRPPPRKTIGNNITRPIFTGVVL